MEIGDQFKVTDDCVATGMGPFKNGVEYDFYSQLRLYPGKLYEFGEEDGCLIVREVGGPIVAKSKQGIFRGPIDRTA